MNEIPAELDILTVNLWGLPWPWSRERLGRKRRFAAHLAETDYDIIGIQELWWPWHRALRVDDLHIPRARRDAGLALASRVTLVGEARVEHFDHRAGLDGLKRKGVLSASIEPAPGARLSAHVTHLQAGREHAHVRARQIDQLLRTVADPTLPAVLMGDFNFHDGIADDERSERRLLDAGFVDAAVAGACLDATYTSSNPYVRWRDRTERLDRVYLRDGTRTSLRTVDVQVVDLFPHPVSDHHPVRVRVRLDRRR